MRSIVVRRFVLTSVLILVMAFSASAWCSSRSQLAAHLTFPVSSAERVAEQRGAKPRCCSERSENNEAFSIADLEFRIADFLGGAPCGRLA
jgi:hypothetical protein